ncbi:hypothetical protein [Rhizobium sp. CCGE 510]|uniref:hypothetical protein n=1 Tax=Rhizobium sp. CCGE 510 TaxID=1132836 RepID=UPI001F0A8884|nr:hypothetical protein [Rhizobium sp. CCGE 510]
MIAYFLVGPFRGKKKEKNKKGSDKNKQRSANYRKKSVLNGIVHWFRLLPQAGHTCCRALGQASSQLTEHAFTNLLNVAETGVFDGQ